MLSQKCLVSQAKRVFIDCSISTRWRRIMPQNYESERDNNCYQRAGIYIALIRTNTNTNRLHRINSRVAMSPSSCYSVFSDTSLQAPLQNTKLQLGLLDWHPALVGLQVTEVSYGNVKIGCLICSSGLSEIVSKCKWIILSPRARSQLRSQLSLVGWLAVAY